MTEVLKITKADLDQDGFYIGNADVSRWHGSVEIDADLGWVRFKGAIHATASIRALAGTGIEAGWGIEAGTGIEAGEGIKLIAGEVAYGDLVEPSADEAA